MLADAEDTRVLAAPSELAQTIHVTVKGLKSRQFLGGGHDDARRPLQQGVRAGDAGHLPGRRQAAAPRRLLRRARLRADARATVELQSAGEDYPYYVIRQLDACGCPRSQALGPVAGPLRAMGRAAPPAWRARPAASRSSTRRSVGAPRPTPASTPWPSDLRGASTDPYDYVRKVIARVQRDARYTEYAAVARQARAARRLPVSRPRAATASTSPARPRCCCGWAACPRASWRASRPARATAPSTSSATSTPTAGSRSYFPRLGWVTFDPTPGDSPARSQQTDTVSVTSRTLRRRGSSDARGRPPVGSAGRRRRGERRRRRRRPPDLAGARRRGADAGHRRRSDDRCARRRRLARGGDPELEELRIALRRSGRGTVPELDAGQARADAGRQRRARAATSPRCASRATAPAAPAPTPRQRRALRRELAAGLGLGGRIRALWALPPRSAELLDALRPRRRRSYT